MEYEETIVMSVKVKILSEQLANKIAAGEVVERPASVVKELVENSLDAGASEVIIEIEDGGKRLIRISDNGCGMSREDALLSLERHATSKIKSDDDLFALETLGFRGEAIPSIASVSRFSLASREKDALEGVEIYVEGGKIKDLKACGMASGTVISVRNLFYNVPARLKFMRSRETEAGHVNEVLVRLALSRPEVRFTYRVDGKPAFNLLNHDHAGRTRELLGKTTAADLFPMETEEGGIALTGLLGSPSSSRSAASSMFTFINGRYVRDKVVQHAILQAYRNVLERGRYPVLVLFINLAPEDVDVNVHPTKHEVRFREQSKVHQIINGSVESLLRRAPWLKAQECNFTNSGSIPRATQTMTRIEEVKDALLQYSARSMSPQSRDTFIRTSPTLQQVEPEKRPPAVSAEEMQLFRSDGYFSSLHIIGQFRASFILCQDDNDLVIIDQHAAHERVVFEELRSSFRTSTLAGQQLLFPETLELLPRESAVLKEQQDLLARLGFELEHFGGGTWLLNGIPVPISGQDYMGALRDVLEEMAGLGSSHLLEEKIDDILATIACHSVVRGERRLGVSEIQHLFARMDRTDFSGHCPHGRPAVARLQQKEIEKLFNRT